MVDNHRNSSRRVRPGLRGSSALLLPGTVITCDVETGTIISGMPTAGVKSPLRRKRLKKKRPGVPSGPGEPYE